MGEDAPGCGYFYSSEPFDGAIDIASMDCAKIMEFVFISRYHRRLESKRKVPPLANGSWGRVEVT